MSIQKPPGKSCEPQLSNEQPNENWDIEQLSAFAQVCHREIEMGEQSLAQTYWRLGSALNLARRHFNHGQWTGFLDELGIDKTRASKARAIQRSFETENSVEGLSVQEAYRKRKRRTRMPGPKKKRRKTHRQEQRLSLVVWLREVCQQVDLFLEEAVSANTEDATLMLPAIETAVEELNRLRCQIQHRITAQR